MHRVASTRGFTVVEILISSTLAAMLLIAMLNTYTFLGRQLTKATNLQEMEYRSRIALGLLNRDFETASAVGSSPTSSTLTLTVPSGTVTYTYDSVNRTLTRVATFGAFRSREFFRGDCYEFTFSYFSTKGISALSGTSLIPLSVKRIGAAFTLRRGN
jgi:Tfp pilus assembly protein PilW